MSSTSSLAGAGMSGREAEVLGLLGDHLSHAEIAARLFISVRTVESHVASLRRKLGVGSHRELVRLAAGYRAAGAGREPAAPRLPFPLTSFVGRDRERAALAAALGTSRLVSAVGPGGIGKTRLALAVAADLAARYPDGTWYADLVPVADPALLASAVLADAGLGESSARSAEDVLAAAVGERRALLVLDNCEHLVNAVAVLTERLLSACPHLAVLVTSRIRLVVPHETVFAVPGLSVSPPGQEGGDAAALFAQRAAAAGAPLPAGTSGPRATAICRALGGMPLAIELAAARLHSLGLDGLEAGLADQLSLLAGGSRQQRRHRSLYDALDWSYRLLGPREQAVLDRVSVFAAPFGLAAAVTVAGFARSSRPRWRTRSDGSPSTACWRLAAGTGGTRYHALEPVRQFAAARLDADGEQQARRRHLAWCLAEAAGLEHADPAGPGWPEIFDAAADEFRAALGWSAARPGLRADACRMAAALSGLLFSRGRIREAQQRYEQAATLAVDAAAAAPALERAAATAGIRTLGEEALRLDRAAAAAYLQAGDSAAASVAFARAAGHIDRFAGMYAGRPAAGTAAALLADARAVAGDDLRAAAAIGCAEAQEASASGGRAAPALRLARQAGDPLLISAALDAITLGQMTDGDISAAASTAAERIGTLPALDRDPRVAFELKDALHTAIFTGVAAGQVARSLEHAERHYALPFLREECHLGAEDLVAPAALAGQWTGSCSSARNGSAAGSAPGGRSRSGAAWPRPRSPWRTGCAATTGPEPAGWPSWPPSAASPSATRCAARAAARCSRPSCCSTAASRTPPWTCSPLTWPPAPRGASGCGASGSRRCAPRPPCWPAPPTRPPSSPRPGPRRGNPVALGLTRRAAALYRGDTAAVRGTAAAFARAGPPLPAGPRARTRDRPATGNPALTGSVAPGCPRWRRSWSPPG